MFKRRNRKSMRNIIINTCLQRLIIVTLAFVFSFVSMPFVVSAHEGSVESNNVKEKPPIFGVAPNNGMLEDPGGILTKEQIKELEKKLNIERKEFEKKLQDSSTGEVNPSHFHIIPHYHVFDRVTGRYDGYYDRGEVASGYNGKNSIDTLSFQISRTVGNSWNANIGFAKEPVSAGVGYNVEWKETKSWTYSATVRPYKTVHIGYQDWYHVTQFDCHTVWINPYYPNDVWNENGSGWAAQWFKPHFYSCET